MADVDITSTADAAPDAAPVVEVDLSSVPERSREYVDKEKYAKDPEYKRAKDHGHVPLEVWVADGKDPDKWVGPKAFNKVFDDMKYRRELTDEVKEAKNLTKTLLKTWEDDKQKAINDALKAQEAQLKQAIADGDAARAVELSSQINEQKAQIPQQQAQQVTPPVIAKFITNNPTINPESPDFNKEYADSVWAQALDYGKQLKAQYGGKDLSPFDIKGILEEVMQMNKPPEKPKTPAKAPSVAVPSQKKADVVKLSASERRTYEMIKTMKDGEKKAAAFLKNLQSN